MAEIVKLRRKPRPFRKTYNPPAPYAVERQDEDDGSITYEVWDTRPDSYRRLCLMNDGCDGDEDDLDRRPSTAKADAELIAAALNFRHQYRG